MVLDIAYRLIRKNIPTKVYKTLQKSLGRAKHWEKYQTYRDIFSIFKSQIGDFSTTHVLEVGCGRQFFTSFYFLLEGASRVVLVEPAFSGDLKQLFDDQLTEFIRNNGVLTCSAELGKNVMVYKNIAEIPNTFDGRIQVSVSHQVLEHFSELDSFFLGMRRLGALDFKSFHVVDLSDHLYHVFDKFRISRKMVIKNRMRHLAYSNAVFGLLNDSKCTMNRLLLSEYRKAAADHGFAIIVMQSERMEKTFTIHPDLLVNKDYFKNSDELLMSGFSFRLSRQQ